MMVYGDGCCASEKSPTAASVVVGGGGGGVSKQTTPLNADKLLEMASAVDVPMGSY